MKLWTWKYIDNSKPEVPNCDKKWEFSIPYLLKSNGSVFGVNGGFSVHARFLCFGFSFITDVSCGKVTKIRFYKWYAALIIRRGWSCEISIGIDESDIRWWYIRRKLKKMTVQERTEFVKEMKDLLEQL